MRVVIRRKPVLDMYDRDDLESLLQIATLRGVADRYQKRKQSQSENLTAKQLRQAIELGTKLAEEEALFKLAMKAKQVAELDRTHHRTKLVHLLKEMAWDLAARQLRPGRA